MARVKAKRKIIGYMTTVLRLNSDGVMAWEKVGYLEGNRQAAREYRERNFPNVAKWKVEAVRVSAELVQAEKGQQS